MSTADRILQQLKLRKQMNGSELADRLGVSRQAIHRQLKKLVEAGAVVKTGTTRGALYQLAGRSSLTFRPHRSRGRYQLHGLEEDRVLNEVDARLHIRPRLSENVWGILAYAFSEMLNNAIDHSMSDDALVELEVGSYDIRFRVRDFGIGIFHSIASKFGLSGEHAAVGELIKGKTTTMKERHSGEGVFFTSRCSDRMSFRSHRIELAFDNRKKDVFINEKRFQEGTEVDFTVSRRSRKVLSELFEAYAPEEYGYRFERTRVRVKLFETEYLSRSEARRLTSNLSRFRDIRLDFSKVKSMGQGFADEVFRVFLGAHPEVSITIEHLTPALQTMVLHVVDNQSRDRLTIG